MDSKIIGMNIKRFRENAGFTQHNLAAFLGVDQSYISKIEAGERVLTSELIEKVASLFGVEIEQLEDKDVPVSKLSFAFRGSSFSVTEMEAIAAINKIALNTEFMKELLEEDK